MNKSSYDNGEEEIDIWVFQSHGGYRIAQPEEDYWLEFEPFTKASP